MTEKRFTLHKGVDTLNIMDNTKFHEHIYINKSSKDMELLVKVLNALHEENEQCKMMIATLRNIILENGIDDRMTAKRFIIMNNIPKGTHSGIWDKQKQHNQGIGDELWLGEVVAMLNEGVALAEENEQLKTELKALRKKYNDFSDAVDKRLQEMGKVIEE